MEADLAHPDNSFDPAETLRATCVGGLVSLQAVHANFPKRIEVGG